MFLTLPWYNLPIENYFGYNECEFVYNINERNGAVINKNSLNKSFTELKNAVTNERILLKNPIVFDIEIGEDGFYFINDDYNIYAYGSTQAEAENNIFEEFEDQYRFYALEDDQKLDDNAKIIKNNLLTVYGGRDA